MSIDHGTRAIDVESWLTEPGAYMSGLGLAGSFYEAILQLFTKLVRHAKSLNAEHHVQPAVAHKYTHELRRFYLWGDGFDAAEGHLDEILVGAAELRANVLSLLFQLSRVLTTELGRLAGVEDLQADSWFAAELAEVKRMQEKVNIVLQDPASFFDLPGDVESLSGSQTSDMDDEDVLDDITVYLDCLMDLCQALENPAVDLIDEQDVLAQEAELFAVSSQPAVNYCRKIRDQYPQLPKFLVERLGELNAVRVAHLLEQERLKLAAGLAGTATMQGITQKSLGPRDNQTWTNPPTESLVSESHRNPTDTTKSTLRSDSIFDTNHPAAAGPSRQAHQKKPSISLEIDDTGSVATFASFSTTASALSKGRPRVPALPEVAHAGGPFSCPACHQELRGITTRAAWKKHIYDDLRPYCCTFETCEAGQDLYSSTGSWAMHELVHHKIAALQGDNETMGPQLEPHLASKRANRLCPFCGPVSRQLDQIAYFKHVSKHLQEVALAALPHTSQAEDDSSFSSASDSLPSGRPAMETTTNDDRASMEIKHVDSNTDENVERASSLATTPARLDIYISKPILPCELTLYDQRCIFSTNDAVLWRKHIFEHVATRSPFNESWPCWFPDCDEAFDTTISKFTYEPVTWDQRVFYQRLDHIKEHLQSGSTMNDARPNEAFRTWLGKPPAPALPDQRAILCSHCQVIWTDPEGVRPEGEAASGIPCPKCKAEWKFFNTYGDLSRKQPTRCAEQHFGGKHVDGEKTCDHNWAKERTAFMGGYVVCIECRIAIKPEDWTHTWVQSQLRGDMCCYCGITTQMGKDAKRAKDWRYRPLPAAGEGLEPEADKKKNKPLEWLRRSLQR
ncbi:hypothetical protein B0T26DRAFT_229158 [Lasiosphaeria miniovina]|uniref:Oxidoreductase acuF-like C2H2 type zinc-finger domain-containing protein n=1 Tax=Lasiosphaeria miniovina TaxID=1954250 RepID=A0AA40AVB9_9PEZI|nr:uncharacterized protein B0T26DRAFT_229158 [Lasiosphaeria miniovina]KAK0722700.1 hypothetical protein B0T26DRAFT_229158 [Lasiosphaeria miniovina]